MQGRALQQVGRGAAVPFPREEERVHAGAVHHQEAAAAFPHHAAGQP